MKRQETFLSESPKQTGRLAAAFAKTLVPGMRCFLCGSVGSGKSTFSRAFVREAYEDDLLEVPSPSYLLQNIYDEIEGPQIHHFDLYRLKTTDLGRLDLDDSFKTAVCLVEWAERLRLTDESFGRLEFRFLFLDEAPDEIQSKLHGLANHQNESQLNTRVIQITAVGPLHTKLLTNIHKQFATNISSTNPQFIQMEN